MTQLLELGHKNLERYIPMDRETLGEAVNFAIERHGNQTRRGTSIPYVSHLFQVTGLVFEHGGSYTEAVAAVLHDVIEDCGVGSRELERRFGAEVAKIVLDCTDTAPGKTGASKGPWKERKLRYIEKLNYFDKSSALVAACDKRHNIGTLVADVEKYGIGYMSRFHASAREQVWYYRTVTERLQGRIPESLHEQLSALVKQLARLLHVN